MNIHAWLLSCVFNSCLLYTSDAADDLTRVDLGGRRIIKKLPPGDIAQRDTILE